MAIAIEQRQSPGWWMDRLFKKLNDRTRLDRLWDLHHRYRGNPPLPEGAEGARELFEAFQRRARTNYAELAVSAVSERLRPVGFRTAVDADENGDAEAARIWKLARLSTVAAEVHDMMLNLGECYVIVGLLSARTQVPVITAEDPRFMVAEADPTNPYELRAALKWLHDDIEGEDRAYLYLPGEVWVARRKNDQAAYVEIPRNRPTPPSMFWAPQSWDWVEERSGRLGHELMPVVPFINKDKMGEYEKHTDVLDRINLQILNRLCIAALQAFRQRAIKGLDDEDEDGNEIDWAGVFTSDPAAVWKLPADAELWESGIVDLRQVLEAVKDDVINFAAVSRTPMYYLNPGGANQSADGAAQQREGLMFKAGDRRDRANTPWAEVMALAFTVMGQAERADLAELETLWDDINRLSLAERADAASKALNDIPRRSRLRYIWGFDPQTVARMESEWEEEELARAQRAALLGAQQSNDPAAQEQNDEQQDAQVLPSLDGLLQSSGANVTTGRVGAGVS